MSELGEKIVEAARGRVGKPFRHHFKLGNLCDYGNTTLKQCMEVGIDDGGYDCSGLVVASICEVLEINTSRWPAAYRHLNQMRSLETNTEPQAGDALIFYLQNPTRTHMGVYVSESMVIHASGLTGLVEEGSILGDSRRTGIVKFETLLALPQ